MDKDMEEMIRKMLEKPSNNSNNASHMSSGNGSVDLNNDSLIKEKLSRFFLQQMLEQQRETVTNSPGPSTSRLAPENDSKDVKVDLSVPDVENLVKLLLQNVKVTNQDKSALEEEKAKRRALEMEAEEMRLKIKAFESMHQTSEAAAIKKKLEAFETMNFFQSGKGGDSISSTMAKYLEDLMLKNKLAEKKLLNDPKWFPGSSKDAESSNTNSTKDKDLFKEMLRNPLNPGIHNFMQPGHAGPSGHSPGHAGPSGHPPGHAGPFHGGPQPPPPFHGSMPPYQQNGYPMGPAPYPWPGHGGAPGMFPQQPPHMYGAPGGMPWHGPPHAGYPGPHGPFNGPNQGMPPQQKKQKQPQPQPQNPPKQKQQQNQPKQKQTQPQPQNPPKQKQQNEQKQKQQNQQPKQKQAANNEPGNPEGGKKKKNAQNQEQNKTTNGAQPKIAVPVGSCVTLSHNSPPSNSSPTTAQNGSLEQTAGGGISLTQEEINKLKQSIQLMNAQAATTGKKKKNKKKKKNGGEGENGEDDDSGSGDEGDKNNLSSQGQVKNQLGGEGVKKKNVEQQQKKEAGETRQVVAAPGEGKKKKKKKAGGEANSEFSLYVGDRWPTLDDINAGRLKLEQPVKNILMVAKSSKGDIISTPKIVQDMLIFNKLHPSAVLVFSSD